MKIKHCVRGLSSFALAVLLVIGLAAPMGLLFTVTTPTPASANSELHPGGRLFFPAWDVRDAKLSFMIITRLAMFPKDQNNEGELKNVVATAGDLLTPVVFSYDVRNNCQPFHNTYNRVANGGTNEVLLTTTNNKIADDVHLEWYGKSCEQDNEILPMSCADIDLIFLNASNLGRHYATNPADQQGALDVHFVINGLGKTQRVNENSLLGYGVIADPTEGWVAAYPAAAAKSTLVTEAAFDGGTPVGYEAFPTEVFIPFALADDSQGGLKNELYLWAPTFYPGATMPDSFGIDFNWFDGRERRFNGSAGKHVFMDFLKTLDTDFKEASFTCGSSTSRDFAENDGAPGVGTPGACTNTVAGSGGNDASHPSDNLQTDAAGFTSTSIGWWDISKTDDTATGYRGARGLVGVVISRTGTGGLGNGDAIRLWHKDPCEIGPKGEVGPPHVRDPIGANGIVKFNRNTQQEKYDACGISGTLVPFSSISAE